MTCEYCKSSVAEGEMKCGNCGAPIVREVCASPDFRFCPMCHRKLLALGSPACNYCGRRLPDEYIRAREGDLRRLTKVEGGESKSEMGSNVGEVFSEARRSNRSGSLLGLVDISSLVDFFN